MEVLTKKWWKAAAIRCLRTMAQTAAATIGTTIALNEVDWLLVASASARSGVLCLLTALGGLPEAKDEE